MTTYERYCEIRDSKGLKDAAVADMAKIGRSTFSDWKSGRSVPKNEKLEKIASVLGVSLEYLLTGNETIKEENLYRMAAYAYMLNNLEKLDEEHRLMAHKYIQWLLYDQEANDGKGSEDGIR